MTLTLRTCELQLTNPWKIASSAGSQTQTVVLFELTRQDGCSGLGEVSPATTYQDSPAKVIEACRGLDCSGLDFDDVPASMAWLDEQSGLPFSARCGLNVALLDGAARQKDQPLYDWLQLGFRENQHVTSFSIGIDSPERIRSKVAAAAEYPVLKLKVGGPLDRENLAALRSVAPEKPVRLDANEGWTTRERALAMLEELAADRHIQFVEQPMPRNTPAPDLVWLKERSPLPLFADESCHTAADIPHCAECFHGVNVKLVKTGGVSMAHETLKAARKAGLKTMIGCMIESSVLISAAAHLAELADFLDLDGNLLITNDPYSGVTAKGGLISFATAPVATGLRVAPRRVDR